MSKPDQKGEKESAAKPAEPTVAATLGSIKTFISKRATAVSAEKSYTIRLSILYLLFGFFFAFHWWFLSAKVPQREKATPINQALLTVVAFLVTAGGGGWCRYPGHYRGCEGGEEMSRGCVWTQSVQYQVIYIGHFIGLAYLLSAALLDLPQLRFWGRESGAGRRLSFFYGGASLLWYRGILAVATLLVTVAWTLVVPWSTHPELTPGTVSLNVLALMLLALVFATFIVGIMLAQSRAEASSEQAAPAAAEPSRFNSLKQAIEAKDSPKPKSSPDWPDT